MAEVPTGPSPPSRAEPRFPVLGDQVPRGGSQLVSKVSRGVLTLFGWRLVGEFPNQPKLVIIAAPHTSNWDWVLAMLLVSAIRLRFCWLGKHTLFSGPFAGVFRALGGIPVDRSAAKGVVAEIVARVRSAPQIALALAPEGTRRRVPHFKSGFYHIAYAAGIPILPVRLDYRLRTVFLMPVYIPTGDVEREIPEIEALYRDPVNPV